MPVRRRGKLKLKIKPLEVLPEKATVTPKFLRSFVTSRSRTPTGSKTKVQVPLASDKVPRLPKLLRERHSRSFADKMHPLPKFSHYPHLARLVRGLKSLLLKVEPDMPVRMPRFPCLTFPPLYTRHPIMKTYTAVTDADGKITVTFPRVFRKIPGVVISPQDAGTWFEHVLSKNEFGFTVQILKTAHAHQHANSGGEGHHYHSHGASGGGGGHDHSVGSGGAHWHSVSGYLTLNLERALAYTSLAVIGDGTHSHSNPNTGGPSSTESAVNGLDYGAICTGGGYCVDGIYTSLVASDSHSHSQGRTGNDGYHTHSLSAGSNYFVYDADIAIGAWTSDTHTGHSDHGISTESDHAHSVPNSNEEPNHEHTVPDSNEKEASLLANTSVTFTYFAQEES